MKLAISDAVALPEDAVTQTFGCIGRRGAGKTYLAGVLAEQMLDLHAQIIVLDAVGNWYGLRVSADGKSKGKDIFVIGGEHGDIPVTAGAGAFNNPRGRLKTLGLIEYPQPGMVRAKDLLFPN